MSYGAAAALQAAVFQRLTADSALEALVGDAIHDAPPAGSSGGTYVTLGPEQVRAVPAQGARGAEHDFPVSVVSDAAGFMTAKAAAAAVSDALDGATLVLARGRLVGLWFMRATARRIDKAGRRRIDLIFRARVED